MNPTVKKNLQMIVAAAKTTFHYGFIPVVIYLGMLYELEIYFIYILFQ